MESEAGVVSRLCADGWWIGWVGGESTLHIVQSHQGADPWFKQAVLVLKYIVPEYSFPTLYLGVANVIANGLIMLRYLVSLLLRQWLPSLTEYSSIVLWVSQNMEDDYTYNLAL